MYHRLIEEYLTHYQPELLSELTQEGTLTAWIAEQAAAMTEARATLLTRLAASQPEISALQRELEADQQVRELFLPTG